MWRENDCPFDLKIRIDTQMIGRILLSKSGSVLVIAVKRSPVYPDCRAENGNPIYGGSGVMRKNFALSKVIPQRKKTVKFRYAREFMEMSDRYREIRKGTGRSLMDTCFWCGHKFPNGEKMWLATREKGANVVLCQTCAES